jgi:hypothetical protein
LSFGLDVQSRDIAETQVMYSTMDLVDLYHPVMDNIDVNAF